MSGIVVLLLRLFLALSLYLFLGFGLWTLWQDLRLTARKVANQKVPAIALEVKSGRQPPSKRTFLKAQVFLGRDPTCDLPLPDPSVSARHALLSFHHSQWWLDDLGSSNGTKLNHDKIRTPTVLTAGDQIQCGHSHILVSMTGDPAFVTNADEEE